MSILLAALSPFVCSCQSSGPVPFEVFAADRSPQDLESARGLWPLTVAESSGYSRSSTLAEVETFLKALPGLEPGTLVQSQVFGTSTEGRALTAVTVRLGDADPRRARVLVNANIHGGEIEGKVAAQILLREFAAGYHKELLDSLELTFVPVFNADGNDAISRANRVTQNGPDEGVGQRPNASGLDLNRDFVKLESPEVRGLTALIRELEPDAFMDLHTTNGSPHGYDLTYASSLSPNVEPALASYMADRFFPDVRGALQQWDEPIYTYDYGNFSYAPREPGSKGKRGDPISWNTYDSRPRFGTNLMGLRGTVSILSEAYSYLPYERRVLVTYGFVLECLRVLARDVELIRGLGAAEGGALHPARELGVGAKLDSIGTVAVRVGHWDEVTVDLEPEAEGVQGGQRRVSAGPSAVRTVPMVVRSRFAATRLAPYTEEFLVLRPSVALIETLGLHLGSGGWTTVGEGGASFDADVFVVEEAVRSQRVFQGHREATVKGVWERRQLLAAPGSLRVPSSMLVAHLLHPESDDSLTTWNFFDAALFPEKADGEVTHPVVVIR